MKKTLIVTLALVFVLGLAGTAFANPYSDVPAGHWAYKAVNDLSKAGIVEGYNGKYNGNATITRYEAAAITARALAKADKADAATKATIDKLAVEFSKELNDLGVRVAKLEKNAGNIKFTGNARLRYRHWETNGKTTDGDGARLGDSQQFRTRIIATGTINDDWKYVGRFEGVENFRSGDAQSTVTMSEAYVAGKLGGELGLTVGRFDYLPASGIVFDDTLDGVKLNIGTGDLTAALVHARAKKSAALDGAAGVGDLTKDSTLSGLEVKWNASKKLALSAAYLQFEAKSEDKAKFTDVAVGYKFDNIWKLDGGYVKAGGDIDEEDTAYQVKLSYKGAAPAVVGSWGTWVAYRNVEAATTYISTIDNPSIFNDSGFEGYEVGFDYAPWKNTKLKVYYNDGDSTVKGTNDEQKFFRAQMELFF